MSSSSAVVEKHEADTNSDVEVIIEGPAPNAQVTDHGPDPDSGDDTDSLFLRLPEPPGDAASGIFNQLFHWPETYAMKMLELSGSSGAAEVLKCNIIHHECFSGTGSSGIALHMLHKAFCREWEKQHSESDLGGGDLVALAPFDLRLCE